MSEQSEFGRPTIKTRGGYRRCARTHPLKKVYPKRMGIMTNIGDLTGPRCGYPLNGRGLGFANAHPLVYVTSKQFYYETHISAYLLFTRTCRRATQKLHLHCDFNPSSAKCHTITPYCLYLRMALYKSIGVLPFFNLL